MRIRLMAWTSAAVLGMAGGGALAEPAGYTRTILQTYDVPGTNYETMIGIADSKPNAVIPRQSHPGPESGYVLEGSGTITVDGQPPIRLKAGQSYKLAPGAVHEAKAGPHGQKLLVIWDVEKGKPFVTMAH